MMNPMKRSVALAAGMLWAAAAVHAQEERKVLVFETETCTTPADAWQKDRFSENRWNLWSTDKDAEKKWSGGVVLQSPRVMKDRATPEEGAPPLHTRITGLPPGRYDVEIKLGRTLAVSRDGKTWTRQGSRSLGVVTITDGTFELWVDDRFAHPGNPGSAYYDCLTFRPLLPPKQKPKVSGHARERVREKLDRGLVALRRNPRKVYLSWRLLDSDPPDIGFNVYRVSKKLNATPIVRTTDFVDDDAPAAACTYTVRAVTKSGEGPPAEATAGPDAQDYLSLKLDEGETFQKISLADLDGDGRYDFVLKLPNANIDPYEKYWKKSPDTYKIEARSSDGRRLWRRDLGWSIERGIWYSPIIVHDLDGDGKAEVALKMGEGDPRDPDGRVRSGPEWVCVLDGLTGKTLARAPWPPRKVGGEELRYNYASRNQIGIAYLDGKTPALIVERGTYTIIQAHAYHFRNNRLEPLWKWSTLEQPLPRRYRGQGAHTLQAVDVDGDGRDEVILGSAVLDDNGVGLWSTGLGHPDHFYVGDIDPTRPGLEIFYGMESRQREGNGLCVVDALSGSILWGLREPTRHVHGYGFCADIDPRHPGAEVYGCDTDSSKKFNRGWLYTAQGKLLEETKELTGTRPVYWDGDLQSELLQRSTIRDYRGKSHPPKISGRLALIADAIGDWREELITTLPGELRVYTTAIPATDRRVCLMQDPIYRNTVTAVMQGYFYNPMLSTLPSASRK